MVALSLLHHSLWAYHISFFMLVSLISSDDEYFRFNPRGGVESSQTVVNRGNNIDHGANSQWHLFVTYWFKNTVVLRQYSKILNVLKIISCTLKINGNGHFRKLENLRFVSFEVKNGLNFSTIFYTKQVH